MDDFFMHRAFDLAKLGRGQVSPNPMVGCVIVHQDKIIGEGWHKKWGGDHAEINAINSVKDKHMLPESSLYVNLEPCAHIGKTPACTDSLICYQLKKVFLSNLDLNPKVSGKGIIQLKKAGVSVEQNILCEAGNEVNKRFFTFHKKKRPYVIIKWAQTSDGFIAKENYDSKWISNPYSRQRVHQWRAEEDAVLVGFRTAAHDNPRLTVRDWIGKNPTRMVLDPHLGLDSALHLFDSSVPTICYNFIRQETTSKVSFVRIGKHHFIQDMMRDMYARDIQSVIIEGGTATINAFFEAGCWDEARVFFSKQSFYRGVHAPVLPPLSLLDTRIRIMDDELSTYRFS